MKNGVRGKYTKQYNEGTNIIRLDNDVKKIFPNALAVNNALRTLINLIPQNMYNENEAINDLQDIPNADTIKAIEDVENGIGLEHVTFEQLQQDMKLCIVN